jgi:Tol biopolymer transport system component
MSTLRRLLRRRWPILVASLVCLAGCTASSPPSVAPSASEPPLEPAGPSTLVSRPEPIGLAFLNLATGVATSAPRWLAGIPGATSFIGAPDGTRLAFLAPDRNGIDQVFVADLRSERVDRITDAPAPATAPAWSPDGERIALVLEGDPHGYRYLAPGRLIVVDLASGEATSLFRDTNGIRAPSFSPDGSTILFTRAVHASFASWRTQLWTVPSAGGHPALRIRDGAFGAFSPDGTLIAYHRTAPQPHAFCIVCWWIDPAVTMVRADGADQPGRAGGGRLTDPNAYEVSLRWSPDGTRVLDNLVDESAAAVSVVDVSTGRSDELGDGARPGWVDGHTLIVESYRPPRTTFTGLGAPRSPDAFVDLGTGAVTPLPLSIRALAPEGYAVSPDGERLAFTGSREGGPRAVFIATLDGDRIRRLTRNPSAPKGMPSWSPDGRSIVFEAVTLEGLEILVARTRGVSTVRSVVSFSEGPLFDVGAQPSFSPDDRSILFTAAHDRAPGGGRWMGLWSAPVRGGPPRLLLRDAGYGGYAPDGGAIAYHPVGSEVEPSWWRWSHRIVVADLPGMARLELKPSAGTLMAPLTYDHTVLRWSPDGSRLVCTCAPQGPRGPVGIWEVPSGRVRFVGVGDAATWLDDDTLIVSAFRAKP